MPALKLQARALLAALVFAALAASEAQASPTCVLVNFFDSSGKPVKSKPAIAAVIGGQLFLQDKGPAKTTFQPAGSIACPPAVISKVSATYKKSCLTAAARDQTAKDSGTPRNTVDQNCASLQAFLSPVH